MDTSAGDGGAGSSTNCQLAIDGFTEHITQQEQQHRHLQQQPTTAAAAFDSKYKIIRPPVRSMSVMIKPMLTFDMSI